MKMKLHYILIGISAMTANTALACRCQQPAVSDAYNDAALVVHARVTDIVTVPSGEGSTAIIGNQKSLEGSVTSKNRGNKPYQLPLPLGQAKGIYYLPHRRTQWAVQHRQMQGQSTNRRSP
jgi:hypothetical protein